VVGFFTKAGELTGIEECALALRTGFKLDVRSFYVMNFFMRMLHTGQLMSRHVINLFL